MHICAMQVTKAMAVTSHVMHGAARRSHQMAVLACPEEFSQHIIVYMTDVVEHMHSAQDGLQISKTLHGMHSSV